VEAIAALRRLRMTGPEIAELLGMATSTVSAVPARIGLGRLLGSRRACLLSMSGWSALVAGASGAFGSAVARALGALGVRLTLASGDGEAAKALSEEIAAAGGTAQALTMRPGSLEEA